MQDLSVGAPTLAVADGTWHDLLNFHRLAYVSSGTAIGSPGASCPPPRPPGGTIMIRRSISVALIAPALAGGALLFTAGAAFAATQNFTANLSSANEVGGGGASLTGSATVTVDTGSGQVCAKVTSDVSGAVAMPIPKGASVANGPVMGALDHQPLTGPHPCPPTPPPLAEASLPAFLSASPPILPELLFEPSHALEAGHSYILVNDHDPKPLYYQFDAEHKGQYTWQ